MAVGVVAEKLICARTMVQCNRIHFIIATTGIVVFLTALTLVVVPFLGSPIILYIQSDCEEDEVVAAEAAASSWALNSVLFFREYSKPLLIKD